MRCRNIWERRRPANRRAKAAEAGGSEEGEQRPPRRSYFLTALLAKWRLSDGQTANPSTALHVIVQAGGEDEDVGSVAGYLLTERVGGTVVAVEGVHDYSVRDARADPSA